MSLLTFPFVELRLPTANEDVENVITYEDKDGYRLVHQSCGPTLGYCPGSGVAIVLADGLAFKSFDGTDTLLPYADWRLHVAERAADLASRLTPHD